MLKKTIQPGEIVLPYPQAVLSCFQLKTEPNVILQLFLSILIILIVTDVIDTIFRPITRWLFSGVRCFWLIYGISVDCYFVGVRSVVFRSC